MSQRRKPSIDLDLINSKPSKIYSQYGTPKTKSNYHIIQLDSTRNKSASKVLSRNEKSIEINSIVDSFLKIRYNQPDIKPKEGPIESYLLKNLQNIIDERSRAFTIYDLFEIQRDKTKKILKIMEAETQEFDKKIDFLTKENKNLKQALAKINFQAVNNEKLSISYILGICKLKKSSSSLKAQSDLEELLKTLSTNPHSPENTSKISQIIQNNENELIGELSTLLSELQEEKRLKEKELQIKLKLKKSQLESIQLKLTELESTHPRFNSKINLIELAETWSSSSPLNITSNN